ncbi:MAG: beta-xylosidase [Acidobacteriota bacterium]
MLKRVLLIALSISFLPAPLTAQQTVRIRVEVNQADGGLKPAWAYVGHDEPNYTYSPEGRELLRQLATLSPYAIHDRAHNLLTTGDGTPALKWGSTNAYTEDAAGKPVYSWKILDRIFDTYKAEGITPYVEIGFMPEALSTHPHPYRHHWPNGPLFTGWAYPPNNYNRWSELIYQWVQHSIERYGRSNVERWEWEVWNEPDIGYWHGTLPEYCKLYDYTAAAVKRALPDAHVGGPASTGPAWPKAAQFLRGFLTHCVSGKNYATGKTGSPLDFISFHAKGRTQFVDGHVQMDIRHSLEDIAHGFAIVAGYPTLRHLPIIISESDPEGCAACAASIHPENGYRNTPQYASYEAELLDGTLALASRYHVNLQGYVTWAFTFPGHPYFYGYRSFATHGIDKPLLNGFRMFGLLQEERIRAESSGQLSLDALLKSSARTQPDIRAIATRGTHSASILVWNYDDNATAVPPAKISLQIGGLPQYTKRVLVTHFRIDRTHSNAYTAWKAMGSPQNPTPDLIAKLKAAGQLQLLTSPQWLKARTGRLDLSFALPRQALSLIRLEWQASQ